MGRQSIVSDVSVSLVLFLATNQSFGTQPAEKLSSLNVTKDKVAFDPKTCEVGATGGITTGCIGADIKIIGRKNDKCLFEYATNGCGGVQAFYRGEVAVDAAHVTIEVVNGGIKYSFGEKNLTLVRTTGPRVKVLIEGTGEYVTYNHSECRSEMKPEKGDKVKFRFRVYDSPDFKQLLPNAAFDPSVEFVIGSSKAWPWLETAMENLTVGDRRQVQVPVSIAADALKWLPELSVGPVLYIEMSLVSVERAK